jgi:hypothetical protein
MMLINSLNQTSWTGIELWELLLNKKEYYMFLKILTPYILNEDIDNEVRTKYQCHIDDNK